eukprot:8364874-Ditylum_brightwellii.AAC.1
MDEFTAFLDKWEQEIIDNLETVVSLDKLMAFMQQGQCLIATDGSASDNMTSFAWKVVDVNGNTYFCHAGQAFGKESLFRTETLENKMYMTVYLDNEGVIERITKQQTYPFDYSFCTIDPDWDIIAQICKKLELMDIKAEFKHMKGYQDDGKHYEELDLPAQLLAICPTYLPPQT